MKRKIGFLPGLVAVVMMLVGCTSTEHLGRFTVISSKNVELSRLGEMTKHAESQKTGNKDLNLKIFWFIQTRRVSQSYELENALDSVIEKVPGGVALVDAQLSVYDKKGFLGFTRRWGYIFEGTVLVDPEITGANQAKLEELAPDGQLYGINNGDNGEITFVDEATFNKLVASVK